MHISQEIKTRQAIQYVLYLFLDDLLKTGQMACNIGSVPGLAAASPPHVLRGPHLLQLGGHRGHRGEAGARQGGHHDHDRQAQQTAARLLQRGPGGVHARGHLRRVRGDRRHGGGGLGLAVRTGGGGVRLRDEEGHGAVIPGGEGAVSS